MKKIIKILFMIFVLFSFTYLFVEARGGGGGGGGSSGSGDGNAVGGAIALVIYAIYEIRRRKMIAKAKKDLEKALSGDSSWNLEDLKKVTENVFIKYQKAWEDKNLSQISDLITKSYMKKATKILNEKLKGKKNILENIKINDLTLMSVRDVPGKDGDMFAMEINAKMIDYTINEKNGSVVEGKKSMGKSFKEYYIFIRYDKKWLLNNIKQKFSIVGDVMNLSKRELKNILKKEKESEDVNDDVFYTRGN